jgi:hypothetical protein
VWEMWQLRSSQPRLASWFDMLGVRKLWGDPQQRNIRPGFRCRSVRRTHPGREARVPPCGTDSRPARLMPESWGGLEPDIDAVPAFASELLRSDSTSMTKLRRQLDEADADERHAFLFIGWEYIDGWRC